MLRKNTVDFEVVRLVCPHIQVVDEKEHTRILEFVGSQFF